MLYYFIPWYRPLRSRPRAPPGWLSSRSRPTQPAPSRSRCSLLASNRSTTTVTRQECAVARPEHCVEGGRSHRLARPTSMSASADSWGGSAARGGPKIRRVDISNSSLPAFASL